ncbi:hypothetical protein SAMN05216270_1101 [Glycomyces harbinensis]|uniref:Uncharacterized protein n=1 Tax=Glycomyces harbinensis TaxID=58114 RepID=A0A1G6Z1R8_9ACTN|nr:hypothetical protein SAMN05216270_1101 [Glycomyces harbinensis]
MAALSAVSGGVRAGSDEAVGGGPGLCCGPWAPSRLWFERANAEVRGGAGYFADLEATLRLTVRAGTNGPAGRACRADSRHRLVRGSNRQRRSGEWWAGPVLRPRGAVSAAVRAGGDDEVRSGRGVCCQGLPGDGAAVAVVVGVVAVHGRAREAHHGVGVGGCAGVGVGVGGVGGCAGSGHVGVSSFLLQSSASCGRPPCDGPLALSTTAPASPLASAPRRPFPLPPLLPLLFLLLCRFPAPALVVLAGWAGTGRRAGHRRGCWSLGVGAGSVRGGIRLPAPRARA